MTEHDDKPEQSTDIDPNAPRERPAWLWKVIWFITAAVILQVVLVWYFWARL